MNILIAAVLVCLIFRAELRAQLTRLAIRVKAWRPANRFNRLEQWLQHILRVVDVVRQNAELATKASTETKEKLDVIKAMMDAPKAPAVDLATLNDLVEIRAAIDQLSSKMNSPEAEQINATYMNSLAQLAKAADAMLQRQERLEKLLEVIITKMNNSI